MLNPYYRTAHFSDGLLYPMLYTATFLEICLAPNIDFDLYDWRHFDVIAERAEHETETRRCLVILLSFYWQKLYNISGYCKASYKELQFLVITEAQV